MSFATVRGAAAEAAKHGRLLPHQLAALENLDRILTKEQKASFTADWRNDPAPAAPSQPVSPSPDLANLQSWLTYFTSDQVTQESQGKIRPLTAAEACGFIGCIIVETGRPLLDQLDVVEAGSGRGRGAMQYTGVRRIPYDRARSAAIAQRLDPNSSRWQQLYFAQEYAGLHDPPQGSLIGWTRIFETRPAGMTPARAADYWTGSAAERRGYFRPGVPHLDRRQREAERVWGLVQSGRLRVASPPPPAPPQPPAGKTLLRLTRTRKMDRRGLEELRLEYIRNGQTAGSMIVVSGAPGAQRFRKGPDSVAGSLEPLPQGRWQIHRAEWAGGVGNWQASWGPALGPVSIPLTYMGPGSTRRSAIEIHWDANHGTSPGTAGCIGTNSIADLKTILDWLRESDPKELVVDWNLP
jgi:hypothetical protein